MENQGQAFSAAVLRLWKTSYLQHQMIFVKLYKNIAIILEITVYLCYSEREERVAVVCVF